MTGLVTGVAYVRLADDAVLDLWQGDDGRATGDRATARRELVTTSAQVRTWFGNLTASLTGQGEVPRPVDRDAQADGRRVDASTPAPMW